MKARLAHRTVSKSLIERLVDAPNLARIVHALDAQTFSALVRRIGIEDAGALIGLATRDQLEAAFDDDLFTNKVPGEREAFDRSRFVLWLEALLAEGDSFAADRIASLPEDLVVEALSSIVAILDEDALLMRMRAQVPDAEDKAAPERPLSTGIDGYVIEARIEEGFDAAVSLIVALDQSRPEYVARILDRCARVTERFVDEADELADALSAEGSLGEDVEAAREARRSAKGFVEARSAAGFCCSHANLSLKGRPAPSAIRSRTTTFETWSRQCLARSTRSTRRLGSFTPSSPSRARQGRRTLRAIPSRPVHVRAFVYRGWSKRCVAFDTRIPRHLLSASTSSRI